jgi:predicted kinase
MDRVERGRIVEGHGDLRPEHIYLESAGRPPTIIDCVEYSAELRTLDLADELAFLAMECKRLGHGDVGDAVIAAYEHAGDDLIPPAVLNLYKCYRACVRAKVAMLGAQQRLTSSARPLARVCRKYLELADHYAAELGPPCLVIIGGLMGTGKSTLAESLAKSLAVDLLATDRIRRSLLGVSPRPRAYGEGAYDARGRRFVYEELFRQARERLTEGQSVVIDGGFLTNGVRRRARRMASEHGAVAVCVWCQCPRDVALSRLARRARDRGGDSEGREDLYDSQASELESLGADEPAVTVDTTDELPHQLQRIFAEMRRRLLHGAEEP